MTRGDWAGLCVSGAVVGVALALILLSGSSEADYGSMRNCPPQDRWAISVWDGPTSVYTGEAMATCGGVKAVYSLDPETQEWQRWFPEHPELSNIDTLDALQGMFVLGSVADPVVTATATVTPVETAPTPTRSPGPSATPAVTATPVATPTASPLPTLSSTPLPSATPTATPTPTQTPVPGSTLQFFSGDGDGSVGPFPLWQGWAVFSFTYEGMFYAGLYDPTGSQIEWFRGGEKGVMIPAAADYTMEVQAQRPWTITVRQ